MNTNTIKLVLTGVILLILFIIVLQIVKNIVKALFPFAVVIIAGYIVYKAFIKK